MFKLPILESIHQLHIKLNQSKNAFEQHYNEIRNRFKPILFLLPFMVGVGVVMAMAIEIGIATGIFIPPPLHEYGKVVFFGGFICMLIIIGLLTELTIVYPRIILRSKFFQKILMKKGQVLKDNIDKSRCELYEYLAQPKNVVQLIEETRQLKSFLNTQELERLENSESWIKKHFIQGHFQNIEELIGEQNLRIVLNNIFFLYEQAVKNSEQVNYQHELDIQFNTMVYGEKSIAIGETDQLKKHI